MQVTLYEIKVVSNVARTFAENAAAAKASTEATNANTASNIANDASKKENNASTGRLTKVINTLTKVTKSNTATKLKNVVATRLLSKAQRTAGINIGMLSLRIAEGLVPVLGLMYTAMLPVVAGLLAIASAAAVATGGIVGLMGVGLYAWSKRFKDTSGGYAGARRPYEISSSNRFKDEVMSGFINVLSDPQIKHMVDTAVEWTKEIFHTTLPNAFKEFLLNVDTSMIKRIMVIFTDWLPDAARGLAKWGSKLFNMIGESSLSRINKLFKYLARGLMNTARWLKEGGFEQIDSLADTLGDFASKLMELGKSVLPILVDVLASIYPNPIRPVINLLVKFFNTLSKSETGMKILKSLIKLLLLLVILSGFESFIASFVKLIEILGILTAAIFGVTAGAGELIAVFMILGALFLVWLATKVPAVKAFLTGLGTFIINSLIFMYNWIAKWVSGLVNLVKILKGDDDRVDYTIDYRPFKYKDGTDIFKIHDDSWNYTPPEPRFNVTIDENQFGLGIISVVDEDMRAKIRGSR